MASERTEYHVTPIGQQWHVKRNGEAVLTVETKEQAVSEARERARGEQPSQVVIHTGDGKVEDESTYTDDPFPPRG